MVEFVAPATAPPPAAVSPPPPPPPAYTRTCEYCATDQPAHTYRDHLISAHSDLLFHCEECDSYVNKKDFLIHMGLHVAQYSAKNKNEKPKKNIVKAEKKRVIKDENQNTENSQKIKIKKTQNNVPVIKLEVMLNKPVTRDPVVTQTVENNANEKNTEQPEQKLNSFDATNGVHNEFSDQSDTEYGFGPLPESVFEAIEDSQDSEPMSNPYTPEVVMNDDVNNTENKKADIGEDSDNKESENKAKKVHTCQICAKQYTARSSYFYHLKYFHKGAKEHECSVCGRKFGTRGCLTQHAVTHTNNCDYECKVCGKKFRSNASLYIHEQSHNGVKMYSCDHCKTSFRWRTHLMRHLKRHAAEKTHKCDVCGRAFAINCDLLRHMRTHQVGDYKCDKCGVKFAQLRYLKVHSERKHSAHTQSNAVEKRDNATP